MIFRSVKSRIAPLGLAVLLGGSPGSAESSCEVAVPARCSSDESVSVELVVHVVHEGSQPVVSAPWLAERIEQANRLFEPVGVSFLLRQTLPEAAAFADLRSRRQRDEIGRDKTPQGAIHLFVVRRLADVDVPGAVIRGVHWRERSASGARWIILSSIAPELVLAHELGHYFGLPHSTNGLSIMNKQKGGGRPPWSSRTFLEEEHQRMQRERDQMLESGWLRSLRPGCSLQAAPPS